MKGKPSKKGIPESKQADVKRPDAVMLITTITTITVYRLHTFQMPRLPCSLVLLPLYISPKHVYL